jgi:hypothetical protein
MRGDRTSYVDGNIVVKNEHGVIVRTSSSFEVPDRNSVFDVNLTRLSGVQSLITYRYDGPCDCDGDVEYYISAAFNLLACSMRLQRQKASVIRLLNWLNQWVPVADFDHAATLAEKVILHPRHLKAATLGRMLRLTTYEFRHLNLKGVHPFDDANFGSRSKREKAENDRQRKIRARREAGARPLSEIIENSHKAFCKRHNIPLRTFMRHKAKDATALSAYLGKMGVSEKWHWDGAVIEEDIPLIERHSSAKALPTIKSSIFNSRAGGASKARTAEGEIMHFQKAMAVGRAATLLGMSTLRALPAGFVQNLEQSAQLDDRLKIIEANFDKQIGDMHGDRK